MWAVVYVATNRTVAEELKEFLTKEGFLVKIRMLNKKGQKENGYYEILVPEAEAEEVHGILLNKGF